MSNNIFEHADIEIYVPHLKNFVVQEPNDDSDNKVNDISDAVATIELASEIVSESKWGKTLNKAIKGVVSIQFSTVEAFDEEVRGDYQASGFVVDSKRGIILTNRHVVCTGPIRAYAVFENHEEAPVYPIYRDPIHEFGFLKFNPEDIKYMEISEVSLRPDLAAVGTNFRIVGNDCGEKLSIMAGVISRLDRNPPDMNGANDFNTEYIQGAVSASGGSSGSPIIEEGGNAVALQVGGVNNGACDSFLPLWRPKRALNCIKNGEPITRGDIQTKWNHHAFDECRRLGLTSEAEAEARRLFPNTSGLLVFEVILPESPAEKLFVEGDVLISIDGEPIATFLKLDEILDANVGKSLDFVFQRSGIQLVKSIVIEDLHAITPDRYVEVAGSIFHELSYVVAMENRVAVKGICVPSDYGGFRRICTENSVLELINNTPISDLEAIIEFMKQVPEGETIIFELRYFENESVTSFSSVICRRHWSPELKLAIRNDTTGLWDFETLQEMPMDSDKRLEPIITRITPPVKFKEEKQGCAYIVNCFAQVTTRLSITMDCYPCMSTTIFGIIIDAERGYILVSRTYVSHYASDIYVTFGQSVEIPGKIVFLHPTKCYAIVKYDPALIISNLQTPKFSNVPLRVGDQAFFVGVDFEGTVITDEVHISSISIIPASRSASLQYYRAINTVGLDVISTAAETCTAGLFLDDDGTIRAFWLPFISGNNNDIRFGLDVVEVLDEVKNLKNDLPLDVRIVNAEFDTEPCSMARDYGVPQEWITRYENEVDSLSPFYSVCKVGAPEHGQLCELQIGDYVLSVDGKLVTELRDLDPGNRSELKLKIVREKKVMDIVTPTISTSNIETKRLLVWCGATIQKPHLAVRQVFEKIPSEVYVSFAEDGSPCQHYGISYTDFITHVNDQETPNLDAFLEVTKDISDGTYLKLRIVNKGKSRAVTLKTDYHYSPTRKYEMDDDGKWTVKIIQES